MLKVGIIGSGFGIIGLKPAFDSVRGCTVVGVCTERTGWRAFLERGDLGAVAIAVPPRAQYEIAKAAIAKGLHVFAEKPLAINTKQARDLLARAKKAKIVHGIDFMFPEIAEWQQVKTMLDKKTFGALRHVAVDWGWLSGDLRHGGTTWRTDVQEGGGALSFYFSHGLHYLEHFAGKIIDARSLLTHSQLSKNGGEVGIDMLLQFEKGVTGYAHVSCASRGRVTHRLVFECERGVIVLESTNAIVDKFTIKTFSDAGEKVVRVKKDIGRKGEDERVRAVRKLAKRFVDACVHQKPMSPSFIDGVRVHELIDLVRAKKV